MRFSSRKYADVLVAAPGGPIDHPNAQALQKSLSPLLDDAANARTPVVLDFTDVTFISSMGLRVLMMAAKQMRGARVPLAVAALHPVVTEIFGIARFAHVIDVYPTLRAALEALSPHALASYDAATP